MSTWDLLEDGFPHGTVAGYFRGCKGAHCPTGVELGLTCAKAKQLAAGDYQYQRLVKGGATPAEIAVALGLHPTPAEAPKPKHVALPEPEDDFEIEGEESIMSTTVEAPSPASIIKSKKPEPQPTERPYESATEVATSPEPAKNPAVPSHVAPSQSEIRAWAHANGVDVNTRGNVRKDVVEAFLAAQDGVPDEKPLPEHGTDARYQRGCHDENERLGDPESGRTCRDAHREKIRESARKVRAARKAAKSDAEPNDEPRADKTAAQVLREKREAEGRELHEVAETEVSTPLVGATEVPRPGVAIAKAGEFAAWWNQLDEVEREEWVTAMSRSAQEAVTCFMEDHHGELVQLRAQVMEKTQTVDESQLEFVLHQWAKQKHRADTLAGDLRVARAEIRLVRDLWDSAERVVSHDLEHVASLDKLIALQEKSLVRLRSPWWKRRAG